MGVLIQMLCCIVFIAYIIDRRSIIKAIAMKNGGVTTMKWKLWISPRPQIKTACDTALGGEAVTAEDECASKLTLRRQMAAAMTNPYNYLFAVLHSSLCVPQAILGGQWLKEYLEIKFKASELEIDETAAGIIAVSTNIGAAVSSLLFGVIGRKYQKRKPYIYRALIAIGFVLWSTTLLIIYVPAECHGHSGLLLLALSSGAGMGAIPIVFAGIRMVNDSTKSADLASGLVSSICMGVMFLSHEVTGFMFSRVHPTENALYTEQEFNSVFWFVVGSIIIGFVTSILVPRNTSS